MGFRASACCRGGTAGTGGGAAATARPEATWMPSETTRRAAWCATEKGDAGRRLGAAARSARSTTAHSLRRYDGLRTWAG